MPILFIIIMVIKGSTLDGAKDGVSQYLTGTNYDGLTGDALQAAKDAQAETNKGIWADAAG